MVVRVHDRDIDHVGWQLGRTILKDGNCEPLPVFDASEIAEEEVGKNSVTILI